MAMLRSEMLSQPVERERNIIRNVYAWMTGGLALTAVVSYLAASTPGIMRFVFGTPGIFLMLIIAELVLVFVISARIETMSTTAAVLSFTGYAMLNGVTLSAIFLVYTGVVISQAFLTAAAAFAGMTLYGFVTRKDLSGIGSMMVMALWGLIIASLLNMFFRSETGYLLISYAGVAVFMGLTAWDTQVIKGWNRDLGGSITEDAYVKLSILGALKLYLDFINIFLFLLRILGRRR